MVIFIVILILLTPNFIIANDLVGTAGMQFLKLGSDARANSMAGAVVGEANDVDSIYWNPAGLSYLEGIMLTATYNKWIGDMNYFYLGYGMPLFTNKLGVIGASITFIDEGSIEDTYGNLGNINELNSYDLAISGAYGLKLGIISVGGALRFITKKILTERSTGGVLDIGGQLEIPKINDLKLGMVVRNLGWASKTVSKPDGMPIMYQAGVSYNLIVGSSTILGLISSDIAIDEAPGINLGLEYGFRKIIYLRGGYGFETMEDNLGAIKGLSFGVGGGISLFTVDLNWLSFGELGQSIQSTISIKLAGGSKEIVDEKSKSEISKKEKMEREKENVKTKQLLIKTNKPVWIKEDHFYKKDTLLFDNFEKEEMILKFICDKGTFEIVEDEKIKYGQWSVKQAENDKTLKTTIRLPDLFKFNGIMLSLKSENINVIKFMLVEKLSGQERDWKVIISGIENNWKNIKIPFRYFQLPDKTNERIDISKIGQIKLVIDKDDEGWIGIDNMRFYK